MAVMKNRLSSLALVWLLGLPAAGHASLFDARALDAHQFNLGLAGFAGQVSPAEAYLEDMVKRPEANAILLSVIDDPRRSPVAKLYALCGLKRIGSGGYMAALDRLRGLQGQVSIMLGDQMLREDIRQAVDRIEHQQCDAVQ
ncbi:hypothetical protein [Delftia sp. PS-11]|uniref:hypothetical protein n=1 Tax=Delftia sp. PS-11 TaxID=2767222 RepID=UPI003AB363EB